MIRLFIFLRYAPLLMIAVAQAGCVSAWPQSRSQVDELAQSYFRIEQFDSRCETGAARLGEHLQSFVKRVPAKQIVDLDCAANATHDATPLAGQPAGYYYYQTYLLFRARGSTLDKEPLEGLIAQTGLLISPASAQTLYAAGKLFGMKGFKDCQLDLTEAAARIGDRRFADEVNSILQDYRLPVGARTCSHPIALHILHRAAPIRPDGHPLSGTQKD